MCAQKGLNVSTTVATEKPRERPGTGPSLEEASLMQSLTLNLLSPEVPGNELRSLMHLGIVLHHTAPGRSSQFSLSDNYARCCKNALKHGITLSTVKIHWLIIIHLS